MSVIWINPLILSASGLSAGANNKLLLHMDGSDSGTTFTDSSPTGATVTATGSAVTHTTSYTTPKFGTASCKLPGSSALSVADAAALRPGSGDFTYAWWQYLNSTSGQWGAFGKGAFDSGAINLQTPSGNARYTVWLGGSSLFTQTTAQTTGSWVHFALVRSGTTVTMYVNGTADGSATSSFNISSTSALRIGDRGDSFSSMQGNIDEFAYWSEAVWTSDFTPPTQAYS